MQGSFEDDRHSDGCLFLTRQTKVLQSDEELWLEQDERVCMRGRLRGGMDGDWTCQHCGRQGCWVTKVRCYRCGKSKYDPPNQQPMDGNPNMPGWSEIKLGNRPSGSGHRPLGVQGLDLGRVGNLWVTNLLRSPVQEEESYEVLLAALNGLIPSSLLEHVRSSLPKPEKPLTERMIK